MHIGTSVPPECFLKVAFFMGNFLVFYRKKIDSIIWMFVQTSNICDLTPLNQLVIGAPSSVTLEICADFSLQDAQWRQQRLMWNAASFTVHIHSIFHCGSKLATAWPSLAERALHFTVFETQSDFRLQSILTQSLTAHLLSVDYFPADLRLYSTST